MRALQKTSMLLVKTPNSGGKNHPNAGATKTIHAVGENTMDVRKIKKGCHAEAPEACPLGIADCALAVMHGVKAFAHMVPFDKLRAGFASP